ncbi:sensor histidine kinase [Paenibacillus physcomitrellae]|uniref:histidine kinase n=1 Tax=Paenibacillus physcomitrellae TaxID=1619311 RepID=A0ABQ1FU73_9BACL|nr:sensor histidine kinase [Paenibacillus physcomitrellae]GGA30866.1 two-component sensor histidine kinase [Paenibacillus physcomitrellae]
MRIGYIYRNYFKKNLFMRMLLIFVGIAVVTIITLSYLMYKSLSQAIINRELDSQKSAMESVDRYMASRYDAVQNMVRDMYRNATLYGNINYLMEHNYADYVEHRMDQFYNESSDYSTEALQYFQNLMDENTDFSNLILYSSEKQILTSFNKNKQFRQVPTELTHSYIPDVMAMETKNITSPNYWIRKAINQTNPALYAIRVPINNRQTLKNAGQLIVYLDSDSISSALSGYRNSLKGEIVVLSTEDVVLYDSKGQYYGQKYPYVNMKDKLYDNPDDIPMSNDQNLYINKLIAADDGYVVIGSMPKSEVAQAYSGIKKTIITISAFCILFAICIPIIFVMSFANRTNQIIKFTRKVKNGDLSARIEDPREDELGQISRSFNDMLDELNLYIERVYKAEIKQKETELVALQARVSPHFLYNTLEVIRMRAISQGARDVGDMIYSLSVLFKNLVNQKKIYTLKDELESCRLYLELFRIRYKDKFNYSITAESDLGSKTVTKLSLQPIIENYIVHGIRSDRDDNWLSIKVWAEREVLIAEVSDNGTGIEPDRLEEIKQELETSEETGTMFGLRSVHSRLRYLYGPEYGLDITSRPGKGTTVRVKYPNREEVEAEHV